MKIFLPWILLCIFSSNFAYAKKQCPDLNGSYTANIVNPVFIDLSKSLNFSLFNISSGEIEVSGNTNSKLTFIWKEKSQSPITVTDLKFNKDYKCDKGWIVFSSKVPASRNNVPGLYYGNSILKLSKDDLYDGLKIESTFSGHEDITLFSYDSAHISISKFWGKKKLSNTIILDTAPNNSSKREINPDSEIVVKVRKMFTDTVLNGIILAGLDEQASGVLVTLNAFKKSDVQSFETRLKNANINYQFKTEPIWTNNSYFLELLVKKD